MDENYRENSRESNIENFLNSTLQQGQEISISIIINRDEYTFILINGFEEPQSIKKLLSIEIWYALQQVGFTQLPRELLTALMYQYKIVPIGTKDLKNYLQAIANKIIEDLKYYKVISPEILDNSAA